MNGTYSSSASAAILTLLQMVNPDIPHNAGLVRPVEIIIPVGTILNAAYPAATTYGNHLCPNNADAIMRALGPVMPERVTAEWNEALISQSTGVDPRPEKGDVFVDIFFMGQKGGSGGIYGCDGYDHIGMIDASGGILDQDYEIFEQATPHRVLQHEYWEDSAGAGRWRGGLGTVASYLVGGEQVKLITFGDGDVEASRGSQGGGEGTLNDIQRALPGRPRLHDPPHQGPRRRRARGHGLPAALGWRRRLGRPADAPRRQGAARRAQRGRIGRTRLRRLRRRGRYEHLDRRSRPRPSKLRAGVACRRPTRAAPASRPARRRRRAERTDAPGIDDGVLVAAVVGRLSIRPGSRSSSARSA